MGLEETPDDPAAPAARAAAAEYYRRMEHVLADRAFLADTYSYADIAFYMAQLFGARKGAPMTDETPRLLAWRERMTARPPCARSPVRWPAILRRSMKRFPIFCAPTSCVRERGGRPSAARATEGRSGVVGVQPRMNASRSALIVSTLDVGMPCGKPAYVFSVFLASFADRARNPHTGRSGRRRHASRERGSWCFSGLR